MATYVNDLRLKEIGTGESSGTWGSETNTNLELIGEALGFGTQDCFSSDADASTTVADGSTDPARAMYFKVTSSATLSATRTLTIAPNTISRVMFIENATTGSQSIAISQGTGANVTIPTGDVKAVYLDGAGSGAAVVDAFANLKVTDAAQTNITSLGTLTSLTVDNIAINDNTISNATASMILDSAGDINLDADGGDIIFQDGGTAIGHLSNSSSDFVIESKVQDKDILFKGDDGGSGITALTLDMSAAGAATFNGAVTADAGVSIDNITIDGTEIDLSSGDLTLDVAGDIVLDAAGQQIFFTSGGTNVGQIDMAGTDLEIKSLVSNADFFIRGNDGGSEITAMTIDMSEGGRIGVGTTSPDAPFVVSNGGAAGMEFHPEIDTDTNRLTNYDRTANEYMNFRVNALTHQFYSSASETVRIDNSGNILLNQTTSLIAGNTSDGSDNKSVMVNGGGAASDSRGAYVWAKGNEFSSEGGFLRLNAGNVSGAAIALNTGGSERMRIDSSGDVGIGASPSFANGSGLEIERSGTATLRLQDSSNKSFEMFMGANFEMACQNSSSNIIINPTGATVFEVGGTEEARLTSTGFGIGMTPAEVLDLKTASGDCRIRLDAPASSDTEIKFFNAGSVQFTIGHDDATDLFVIGTDNVDTPKISLAKTGTFMIGTQTDVAESQLNGALKLGIGVNTGIGIKRVSVASSATTVFDVSDFAPSDSTGDGIYMFSLCRTGGSYGTRFVGILGVDNAAIAILETIENNGFTITVSGMNLQAAVGGTTVSCIGTLQPLAIGE